ncbi:MAG: phosphoribosylformylglycinamidine synthase subunit PurQ [Chloroflexi bacterium]|jgi:phosphoribosylformylglycinamidine synthase subunit PurQ / glutaminase|nr:phosphoribosylformylglycinamidine synthase subunit PurQ [Chloroflexota bacterium]
MKFGVLVFPGTWSDMDFVHVIDNVLGQESEYVWHKETDLSRFDCVILPGGFSYGDYLRVGAIARFSPVMTAVEKYAADGGLVFGSCNGFQILCEAGLLPGVLLRSVHLQYRCQWVNLRVENTSSPFVSACNTGDVLHVPISHYEGCYYADEATLAEIESNGQVALRYATPEGEISNAANPNGSINNIAGITNKEGNVLGLMPHPERCCEEILGGMDGLVFFDSILPSKV